MTWPGLICDEARPTTHAVLFKLCLLSSCSSITLLDQQSLSQAWIECGNKTLLALLPTGKTSNVTSKLCARTTFRLARTAFLCWRMLGIGLECYCSQSRPKPAQRNKIRGNIEDKAFLVI